MARGRSKSTGRFVVRRRSRPTLTGGTTTRVKGRRRAGTRSRGRGRGQARTSTGRFASR